TSTTDLYTLSLHDALPIFAAEEPQARRPAGDGEGEGVTVQCRSRQSVRPGRIDGDLVGQRPQSRQDTGASHYNPFIALPDHRKGDLRPVVQERARGSAVTLQVDQGM